MTSQNPETNPETIPENQPQHTGSGIGEQQTYQQPQPAPAQPAPDQAQTAQGATSGANAHQQPFVRQLDYSVLGGTADPKNTALPLYGATFGQALVRFFKNYANFNGRASRSEYWYPHIMMQAVLNVGLVAIFFWYFPFLPFLSMAADSRVGTAMSSTFLIITLILLALYLLLLLALVIPTMSLIWRRLHDANQPGALGLLVLLPSLSLIPIIIFGLLEPDPNGRKYDRNEAANVTTPQN